jgi:hypothetical protein
MKTLDLKKDLKHLYQPSAKKPEILKVPKLQFAMIDGAIEKGKEPGNSRDFRKRHKPCTAFRTRSSSCSRNAKQIH